MEGKTGSVIKSVQRIVGALPYRGGIVAAAGIIVMAILIATSVVARYAFNRPMMGVDEYAAAILVVVAMAGLSLALKERRHVKVDFIIGRLPPRVAKWVELGTYLFGMGFLILFMVLASRMVATSIRSGAFIGVTSPIPLGPMQIIMVIGVGLLALQMIVEFAAKIRSFKQER